MPHLVHVGFMQVLGIKFHHPKAPLNRPYKGVKSEIRWLKMKVGFTKGLKVKVGLTKGLKVKVGFAKGL